MRLFDPSTYSIFASTCVGEGEFGGMVAVPLVLVRLGLIKADCRCARLGPSTMYILFFYSRRRKQ